MSEQDPNACTIVAIARNEAKYIVEWLAYHLVVGFEKIIVFDNSSADDTFGILSAIAAEDARIEAIEWPPVDGVSPQLSAYNSALEFVTTPWVTFIDIDEFVVPWRHGSISKYLETISETVSAVHVNWRCFGSSGKDSDSYDYVIENFTTCAKRDSPNNYHYKTFGRKNMVRKVYVHQAKVLGGRSVLSNMQDLASLSHSVSQEVVHEGIQINHYQSKTFGEFQKRMLSGDANVPDTHPDKGRDGSFERFKMIDLNEDSDDEIAQFVPRTKAQARVLSRATGSVRRRRARINLWRALAAPLARLLRARR